MKQENSNERITLVYILMCCLNFAIILYTCGLIAFTLKEIINMNIAREFLDSLPALPITPPFKSLQMACISYLLFLGLQYLGVKKSVEDIRLVIIFTIETILCIFIMYCMGYSSNAIVLLFIAGVLNNAQKLEYRFPFLIIGALLFTVFNNDILSQLQVVTLADYISVYDAPMRFILQSTDSIMNTLNIIAFVFFMFLLIYKEINNGKQMRVMNEELRTLNEQLKEYALLQEKMGETKERNRLAREIHDTLGHTLTGLSVGIDAAMMVLDIDSKATRKQLSLLSETARQGLQDVRRSVERLRPDALERYALKDAIKKMIDDFITISNVNISFKAHLEDMNFGSDIEEFVYRFVQEGTTNAVRHGEAKNIVVSFAIQEDVLILLMEDDGKGCKNIEDGFGIHHMKERLMQFNGTLRTYGEHGFTIIAEVPLRKENYD